MQGQRQQPEFGQDVEAGRDLDGVQECYRRIETMRGELQVGLLEQSAAA